ncbi:MCP four helix bundle domain-containing protein [Parasutterella excrementihominis]
MFGKDVEKKENRGAVMCFLVAVYTITSIVFLLQVNQYTQDIYDFPYLVSSQARIMKSRLYDFRSLTPVLFSSKDLNSAQLESALKTQEALQQQSITIIEDRYRGSPEELQELKDALKNIGQRRRELVELTREDPTVENVIKHYNQIVEPAFIHFDDILDRIASNADQRGSDINDKSDRNIYGFVIGTIIMGILLLWFIYTGSKDLNRAYVKGLKRDKLLKEAL